MDYWQNQIKQIIHYSKAERILDRLNFLVFRQSEYKGGYFDE